MRFILLIVCIKIISINSTAFDFYNYKPLESKGEIPQHILTLSSEKYEELIKETEFKDREEQAIRSQFYLGSNFSIDKLLRSGIILFNDPLSDYVNRVMDVLLEHDPELRKEIKIYVVKSPVVNAFASDQGVLLVNVGLIAQLESEAQLAFILAHELTHFIKKHAITRFKSEKEVIRGEGIHRNADNENPLIAVHAFSRELEEEADREGLNLYKTTNYCLNEVEKVFDVLHYSYLPFREAVFNPEFLEIGELKIAEDAFPTTVNPINVETEDYDDSHTTHPSTAYRKELIKRQLLGTDNTGRVKNILAEEEFITARTIARFEQTHLFLQHTDYVRSLYNAYLLLREFPENPYLERKKIKSLYGLSKYANIIHIRKVVDNPSEIEGQIHSLFYFFRNIHPRDLNIIAFGHAWDYHTKHPKDVTIKKILDELSLELFIHDQIRPSFFSKIFEEFSEETEKSEIQVEKNENIGDDDDKYALIRTLRSTSKSSANKHQIEYAFVDFFKNEVFESYLFDRYELARQRLEQIDRRRIRRGERFVAIHEVEEKQRNISKIVDIDPFYATFRAGRTINQDYLRAEAQSLRLIHEVNSIADMFDIETDFAVTTNLKSDEITDFNDLAFLKNWYSERLNHENRFYPYMADRERVQEIVKRHGTPYFSWRGVINLRQRGASTGLWVSSVFLPVIIPYVLYKSIFTTQQTIYYNIVFDITDGKIVILHVNQFKYRDRDDLLRAHIYESFMIMDN